VVTNGMSQYSRAERNANAGMVVGISRPTTREPAAFEALLGATHGVRRCPRARRTRSPASCCSASSNPRLELGGGNYSAPAQRVATSWRAAHPRRWAACSPPTSPA
jgi:uncharacterized FAD-dependent dehydrogenase